MKKERYMSYLRHLSILLALCIFLGNTPINAADNPAQGKPDRQPELKVINLAVYPAPIPRPAMKYHLLPRLADQTPGNAALLYDTIFILIAEEDGIRDGLSRDLKDEKEKKKFATNADKLSNWLNTPLAELPKDEIHKILDNVQPWIMEYAEMASHRMQCDWDLPSREIKDPSQMLLPELHRARSLARILAMQARLSLAERKPEDALKTLQIGFALSRQIGTGKVPIVNCLVGNAIANMMREQLLDLTQLKDAPNLYWSLSNVPHPFLNSHDAVEGDDLAFTRFFSELQEARKGQHSPEQWQKLLEVTIDKLIVAKAMIASKDPKTTKKEEVDIKKLIEENYPIARDYLVKLGWPEKDILSMAPSRVLLLYGSEMWNEMYDDGTKWTGINYSQWPSDLRENYNGSLKKYENFPLSDAFQVMGTIAGIQARTERDFDSLRCIEAIRLYAYSHGGKLPSALDDIKEVPIPPNPMTGKPFSYRLEGDTAVLTADGDMEKNSEYHIKIAK
jgi:hypothetical protein